MKADKVITLPTNFNNKLACPYMTNIDLEPRSSIPESLMARTVIKFETADKSFPPTYWKLFNYFRLGSERISDVVTIPSHGMDACDFYQWLIKAYTDKGDYTKLAVYFYKKIDAE